MKIIRFLEDCILKGEEFNWELVGVTQNFKMEYKKGDYELIRNFIPYDKDDDLGEMDLPHEEAENYDSDDDFIPFYSLYDVNKNQFEVIKDDVTLEEGIKYIKK